MTLGALIVLAGLVFAGIYLPKKSTADNQTKKIMPLPAPLPTKPKPTPAIVENPTPEPPPKAPVVLAKGGGRIQEGGGDAESNTRENAQQIEQIRDDIDQLAARAGSVNESLDRLKQQQAAAGYGLRGDMAGRQESMKINLSRAQDAAEKGDSAKAKKYADKMTSDLETLEKFLGR